MGATKIKNKTMRATGLKHINYRPAILEQTYDFTEIQTLSERNTIYRSLPLFGGFSELVPLNYTIH